MLRCIVSAITQSGENLVKESGPSNGDIRILDESVCVVFLICEWLSIPQFVIQVGLIRKWPPSNFWKN